MTVRALDVNHDWQFGRGANDYLTGVKEIAQNLNTRIESFLGDCFFSLNSGINWFGLLGAKNQVALNVAVSTVIINTKNVTGIKQLSVNLDHVSRKVTITYEVNTIYTGQIEVVSSTVNLLLDESGNIITTEDDDPLQTG